MSTSKYNRIKNYLFTNTHIKQTLLKNGIWIMIAEFLINGSKFAVQLVLARVLGVAGFGTYSFIISFIAFFQVLATFGFPWLIIREVSKQKKSFNKVYKLYYHTSIAKIIIAFSTFALLYVISQVTIKDRSMLPLIYLAGIFTIIQTFSEFLLAFSRGYEKMEFETFSRLLEGLLYFLICIPIIFLTRNLFFIFLGFILVTIINLLLNISLLKYLLFKQNIFKRISIQFKLIRRICNEGKFIAVSGFAFILYNSSDQLVIHFFHGDIDTGYYSAAYHIILVGTVLSGIIRKTIDPFLSHNTNYNYFMRLRKYSILCGIVLFVIAFSTSHLFIKLFFGAEYLKSVFITQLLSITYIPIFFNALSGSLLIMKGKQKEYSIFLFFSLCFNIAINLLFIPTYSYIAAAISTILAETLLAILSYTYIYRNRKKIFHFGKTYAS